MIFVLPQNAAKLRTRRQPQKMFEICSADLVATGYTQNAQLGLVKQLPLAPWVRKAAVGHLVSARTLSFVCVGNLNTNQAGDCLAIARQQCLLLNGIQTILRHGSNGVAGVRFAHRGVLIQQVEVADDGMRFLCAGNACKGCDCQCNGCLIQCLHEFTFTKKVAKLRTGQVPQKMTEVNVSQ